MARFLRTEQIGGLILLGATALALIVANSPLAGLVPNGSATRSSGPQPCTSNLTVSTWAKDGLLAIFFVVAGLELKRELVVGELRNPRQAMLPIAGALGGMIVPALVCLAVAWGAPGGSGRLAGPGRDRHRLRARGARHHRPATCRPACGSSCSPSRSSTISARSC